jgi:hypothetical protein
MVVKKIRISEAPRVERLNRVARLNMGVPFVREETCEARVASAAAAVDREDIVYGSWQPEDKRKSP